MRFHVVGLPFEPQPQCAYHGKHVRFIKMMRDRGHTVFEYAAPSDVWDPARAFDPDSATWQAWNARAVEQIRLHAEPRDFVCVIAGRCQQPIAAALPHMMTVEYGVGYGGTFAPYRVFESYAWMHTVYGSQAKHGDPHAANGSFYDTVIPNYFDLDDFPAGQGGDGYVFIGRLIDRKGAHIAAQVCEHLGVELTIAGEGDPPAYGNHIGVVGPDERAELIGNAAAVFAPTLYVEPFGGVAAEAMLTGTPVITTDFGAFTETVEPGVTGYRCHTFQEFCDAARLAPALNRDRIRALAISRWSLDAVAPQYDTYFHRLADLWEDGWYQQREAV